MSSLTGVIYFSDEAPHITGHLKVGKQHFQITGIRVDPVIAKVKSARAAQQQDLFENEQASDDGEEQRDLA